MDDLFLRCQGINGGNIKVVKKGFIEAQYGGDYVDVDIYTGQGIDYKKRKTPRIGFKIKGERYSFSSFEELKKQLDKK